MRKTRKNYWQKVLFVLCLALATLLPAAQAAEPALGKADAWSLLNRACELANGQKQFGANCEVQVLVKGSDESGIRLFVSDVTTSRSSALSGNHTEGLASVNVQLPCIKKEFSMPMNIYNVVKGKKISVYSLQNDGSWQVETYKTDAGMTDKLKAFMEKSPLLMAHCFEAAIAGEKDGIVDISLSPRPDVDLSELQKLSEGKELAEMEKSMGRYFVPFKADNTELHLFINRATGEMVSLQADLSRWLKEEMLLLNKMPEVKLLAGLPFVDFSDLECSLIMNCRTVSLPQDYKVTVPDEIRKKARKAGKK